MKLFYSIFSSLLLATSSQAAVALTFDTDSQGVGSVDWNTANGNTVWSANNGGSLAMNILVGGWSNPLAKLDLLNNPAVSAEFASALANGGTLTFDFTVSQIDFTDYLAPDWFEIVAVGNSDASAGGGWDQNVFGGASGIYGGIPTGPVTVPIGLTISAGPPAENDGNLTFGAASSYKELMIGINSQPGKYTSGIVYLDNFVLTANTPIPEPATTLFGTMTLLGLAVRRRR